MARSKSSSAFSSAGTQGFSDFTQSGSSVGRSSGPVITENVEIRGEMSFAGELTFNGRFEGDINAEGHLTIGEQALIKGNVLAGSADIGGKISGSVLASGQVHLQAQAVILGDVTAESVSIEQGAFVKGKVTTTQTAQSSDDFSHLFQRLGTKH
jgi:cytoskeletal protein CcmA (bactofilin family)